ncbi:MAG: isoleucine--tRNA ligase [candidate division Zixibacteria bacterium]|nr:isoleucine--tRNA ligase [candidate division Zixibacteria bacterium]
MFRQYDKSFDQPRLEEEILKFWEENDIFKKTLKLRQNGHRYIFYEGPPTANGLPGIHHALSRTIKDSICRYKSMKGHFVERKAGWDTHGLPVELNVEGKIGIKHKDEIEKYGIEKFNKKCRESVWEYKTEWDEFTRKIGYWIDLENPYITYTNDYVESVWWILKKFHDEGLLYKGHKIIPWCPRCETALSSHEIAQGYQEVSDPSIFVKIRLKDEPDTYFLVWTTTPWTLISNTAVALAPDETYVKVKHEGQKLILASARVQVLDGEYEVIDMKTGREYEHTKYEPLFDYMADEAENGYFATIADFVTMDDGTGIVHCAPAFGADDYKLGKKYNLPVLQAVATNGEFIDKVTRWAGKFVKQADPEITEDLKERGQLYKSEQHTHTYPFCWRCDSPLLYYARSSWFIRTTSFKDKMMEINKDIGWYPPEIGEKRFGEWLENNIDWALSRERYWGTPLPIWICSDCSKEISVGSIDQLKKSAAGPLDEIDLHRPYVDDIKLKCPDCGGEAVRVKEVIDAWFDSGSMPYGQAHYPFENKDNFEEIFFPAEFIAEGLDQTRGWFYSMLAISAFVSGKSSYKKCIVNNMVLDIKGKKMSKRIGNVLDPKMLIAKFGADVIRWYLMNGSQIWIPKRFDEKIVVEVLRKFFSTLQNSYSFFALYADLDKFDPNSKRPEQKPLIDAWLISRLNGLIKGCEEAYEAFDLTKVTRLLGAFIIDELSNWWIKRSRKRFWGADMSDDKLSAYHVLYDSLLTVCKLAAPIAPFITEDIYRRMTESFEGFAESIHHEGFPIADESKVNKELNFAMSIAENIVSLGRAARKDANVKVRQPVANLIVINDSGEAPAGLENLFQVILEELNVKSIEFTSAADNYIGLIAEPIFKVIGPKFGKLAPQIAESVKAMTDSQLSELRSTGSIKITCGDSEKVLTSEEILIKVRAKEGYAAAADGRLKVAINLTMTEQLLAEGFARELINKIQNMRKGGGLEVTDRIHLGISQSTEADQAVKMFGDYIVNETLAVGLDTDVSRKIKKEWNINGIDTVIALEKI